MNKQMLMVMDSLANPKKYTIEQLRDNCDAAATAARAADAAYAASADAFYAAATAARADLAYAGATAAVAATTAVTAANCAVYAVYTGNATHIGDVEIWVDQYFERSRESKQDYIDEINKTNNKGNNMTIDTLTIECAGVAGISARNDAAGQPFTKVTLEDVQLLELMASVIAQKSVEDVLECITNHDIELYMKGQSNE